MIFRSYYTKIIVILSLVFWLLFTTIGVITAYTMKNSIFITLREAQKPRMKKLFTRLYRMGDIEEVRDFLENYYIEVQIDIYDKDGKWICGNDLYHKAPKNIKEAAENIESRISGFSAIYNNPYPDSLFQTLVLTWESAEKPILTKTLYLIILFGVITALVAVLVGWLLSYSLNKRLARLENAVNEVEKGNYEHRIDIKGEDEIARLAKNFNRMAEQLRDSFRQIEENSKNRKHFIAHASHEIRTPVTSINGFVDIVSYLGFFNDNPERMELLESVKKDIRRIIKIADDLVLLSKFQEPDFKIELESIKIAGFIKIEHRFFCNKAKEKNVSAVLDVDMDDTTVIQADPDRLSQILDNLWTNALKYGDFFQPVRTMVTDGTGVITIVITNAIREKIEVKAEKLLEPLYRYPKYSSKAKGSGLGLAIASELVNKMGGKLELIIDNENKRFSAVLKWMAFRADS
jgi:signal transduction histidine kinase